MLKRLVWLFFASAVLLFASTVEAAAARVVVKSGDQLALIEKEHCGTVTQYARIARENGIKNPDRIYPGQVITVTCGPEAKVASEATNSDRLVGSPVQSINGNVAHAADAGLAAKQTGAQTKLPTPPNVGSYVHPHSKAVVVDGKVVASTAMMSEFRLTDADSPKGRHLETGIPSLIERMLEKPQKPKGFAKEFRLVGRPVQSKAKVAKAVVAKKPKKAKEQENPLRKYWEQYAANVFRPGGMGAVRHFLSTITAENHLWQCRAQNDPVKAKAFDNSRDNGLPQINDMHRKRFPQWDPLTCEGSILIAYELFKEDRKRGRSGFTDWKASNYNKNWRAAMRRYADFKLEDQFALVQDNGDVRLASYTSGN